MVASKGRAEDGWADSVCVENVYARACESVVCGCRCAPMSARVVHVCAHAREAFVRKCAHCAVFARGPKKTCPANFARSPPLHL